jgi:hypothetical protein
MDVIYQQQYDLGMPNMSLTLQGMSTDPSPNTAEFMS